MYWVFYCFVYKLDDDGMVAPGENIEPDDIYINRQSPIDTHTPTIFYAENLPDRFVFCF